MKKTNKIRRGYLIGFFIIIALLGLAEYLEIYKQLVPCPLCMLQRVLLMGLGVLFLLGMLFRMRRFGSFTLSILSLLVSASGILLSGRQVWLQHMPPNNLGECGANLSYLFNTFPVVDVLKHVWTGGIECSQQGWSFLSFSLAEWSLVGFVVFAIFSLVQAKRVLES